MSPSSWPTYTPARQFGSAHRSVPAWKPLRRPWLPGFTAPVWLTVRSVLMTRPQAWRGAPAPDSSPTRWCRLLSITKLPWRNCSGSAANCGTSGRYIGTAMGGALGAATGGALAAATGGVLGATAGGVIEGSVGGVVGGLVGGVVGGSVGGVIGGGTTIAVERRYQFSPAPPASAAYRRYSKAPASTWPPASANASFV